MKDIIRIGIVGAGPAGLVSALGIEAYDVENNFEITILDKNKSFVDYPGVEYGIQARACHALDRIGIKERALHRGVRASEIKLYNSRINKKFHTIKSDPSHTRCVVRQEFLHDLSLLLKRTTFISQCEVKQYIPNKNGSVQLKCEMERIEKKELEFDLVIACDGSFSRARKQFFPNSSEKIDRSFSCLYMLLEAPDVLQAPEKFLDLANGSKSEIIMGKNCTITLFPLGKNRLAYGIGFDHNSKKKIWENFNLSQDTYWKDIDKNTKKKIAQTLVHDATPHEEMYKNVLEYVKDWNSFKIYLWKMADTNALTTPNVKNSNIILIGDASHAIMPTIGMGASLAIEDAEILTRKLVNKVQESRNKNEFYKHIQTTLFPEFTAERVPVWKELIRRARLAAKENFIDLSSKKRFASGPQIPNNKLSQIVSFWEKILRKLNL